MKTIYGLHDPGGEHLMLDAGRPGWLVHTVSLKDEGPNDYRLWTSRGGSNIVRLNWHYGNDGTIPLPQHYGNFADLCRLYVAASPGCNIWIIGNEINHSQERPQGQEITPRQYAECFRLCRNAIKSVQPDAIVVTAAIAPWNVTSGDWLDYFQAMLQAIGPGNLDGIALHTYTHGADPGLVTSEQKMGAPYGERRWHFRAYQDFLARVPTAMRRLPVYITETNQGDHAWVDTNSGWVQAAYREIDAWNRMGATQKIHCLALYRWPNYDKWGIEHKHGVQADFRAAMAHGYESPKVQTGGGDIFLPVTPKPEGGTPVTVNREWDSRLDGRGVKVVDAPSGKAWRVVRGQWYDESQAGGRHHIYVEALDEQGNPLGGVPFVVSWPGGQATQHSKTGRGFDAGNFPMSASLNEFSVRIDDALPSDTVSGIGMGANGNAGIHTSTLLTFQRLQTGTVTPPPQTGEGPSQPPPTQQPTPQPGDTWARCYAFVRKWEGGWADNPNDPGGATMKGITLATYTRWRQAHGQPAPSKDDLRNISDAEVERIYREWYWQASGASSMPWPLCLAQFDTAVNAGVGRAQEMFAKSNGNFLAYVGHLIDWYTRIPNFEHFGKAWIRRRADLLLEASHQ